MDALGFVMGAWLGFDGALACRLAVVVCDLGEWRVVDFGVDDLA